MKVKDSESLTAGLRSDSSRAIKLWSSAAAFETVGCERVNLSKWSVVGVFVWVWVGGGGGGED